MNKIAFVSTIYIERWGGSEELWSQAAAQLVQSGVEVSVNVQWWAEPVAQVEALIGLGCKAWFRNKPGSAFQQIRAKYMPGRFRYQMIMGKIYEWLDAAQPDLVVVAQGSHLDGSEYMNACAERNIPYVTIAQAAYEYWWPFDGEIIPLAKLFEKAAACYYVSEANLNLTRNQLAIPLLNGKVVRNPFNVSYDVNLDWPRDTEGLRLACVARLEPKAKGQDLLFEVLAQEKWRKRPLQVTLYGSGLNEQNLRNLQKMYNLPSVTFGGFVSNIEQVWATHHALVLASRYEGLPLAIVEAMLCRRPCIVTNVAGNAELIDDGVEGFIAAAPSKVALDEAMERAWQQRADWQAIGQNAGDRVRRHITPDPAGDFARELRRVLPAVTQKESV